MSAHRACWIECDECGNTAPVDMGASSVSTARQQARSLGWVRRKGRDVCGDCVDEPSSVRHPLLCRP